MLDTDQVRKQMRETFAMLKVLEVTSDEGRLYLPARPVYKLEGIIEMLIAQIEHEQKRNKSMVDAVDRMGDHLKVDMTRIVLQTVGEALR